MAKETSKAMRRRWREDARGEFQWKKLFSGKGIDVGAGDDPLPIAGCVHFDQPQGDANDLGNLFPKASFDFIHASQSLEHMRRPEVLWNWMSLLKSGGHAIITVPSWELYEGMRWPSIYNPDHKSTWSMNLRGSPAPFHVHVPTWIESKPELCRPVLSRQLAENYDYKKAVTVDQTWIEANGVEPWIEFVLVKL